MYLVSEMGTRSRLGALLEKHRLTQQELAAATGLAGSAVSDIANGKRCPTTATVNKILAFVRRYEPKVSYEDLFAPELVRKGVA